jgi:hypothetical protein
MCAGHAVCACTEPAAWLQLCTSGSRQSWVISKLLLEVLIKHFDAWDQDFKPWLMSSVNRGYQYCTKAGQCPLSWGSTVKRARNSRLPSVSWGGMMLKLVYQNCSEMELSILHAAVRHSLVWTDGTGPCLATNKAAAWAELTKWSTCMIAVETALAWVTSEQVQGTGPV